MHLHCLELKQQALIWLQTAVRACSCNFATFASGFLAVKTAAAFVIYVRAQNLMPGNSCS